MLLLTNKKLLTHCDTAELSLRYPEPERALFTAAHRLLASTIEHIRITYDAEFLPWLDEPISHDELSFLRNETKDFSYAPDLRTPHPDASRKQPSAEASNSDEDSDTLTQDFANGANIDEAAEDKDLQA
jgi:hypothetical protein